MSKQINQQAVLARFRERHGDLYDYGKVRYRKMIVKVEIVCSEHGIFRQTPDKHLQGTRCPRCMIGVAARLRKAEAASEFKQKAIAVHGNKYDYSDVTYTGNKNKIIVRCPQHGKFQQTPTNHLSGFGCPKCGRIKTEMSRKLSSSDFFRRCVKAHKGKYKYPVRNYKKPDSIIAVTCPQHGAFKIKARNHLWIQQGCNDCFEASRGITKRIDWKYFLTNARKKHGLRYKYSRRSYSMMSEKVKIKCAEHGWFFQQSNKHLAGQGCEKCVRQSQRGKWHSSSLQKKSWELPAAFYYLKFKKRDQIFYKIGITNDIQRRAAVLRRESGYDVQVLYSWESNLLRAMKLEEKVQRDFKDFSFKPRKRFPGYTECYVADILGLDF